ncbi:hypothetical protein BGY98DRAFT_1180026 [Russula aff. rugulosa BPL654]|nr:hypothetical protein BGY98DRAFT_1180026 [Russula aff. rugulosa BPL654]
MPDIWAFNVVTRSSTLQVALGDRGSGVEFSTHIAKRSARRRSLERWPERSGATPLVAYRPKERLVVHLQIALCNYTRPPRPSANAKSLILRKQNEPTIDDTPIAVTFHRTPPAKQRRTTSISQQQFHNQGVCCGHQFMDCCCERESPARPRAHLRLDPQASPGSPDGASRLPLHTAHPYYRTTTTGKACSAIQRLGLLCIYLSLTLSADPKHMAAQAVRQLMTGEIYVVGATAKYYAKAVEDDKDYNFTKVYGPTFGDFLESHRSILGVICGTPQSVCLFGLATIGPVAQKSRPVAGGRPGVIRDIEFTVVSKKKHNGSNNAEGLHGRDSTLGEIVLRGGLGAWAPLAECWIGGKWEDGGLIWWFGWEREEHDEGERERSDTGWSLCTVRGAIWAGNENGRG